MSVFKRGMYQWCKAGVIKEFYIKDGKFYLPEVNLPMKVG
jgi:hypothetical protein